ncbi:hypothetical protein BS17DRAFT_790463, partial [Gyrodon lividus]
SKWISTWLNEGVHGDEPIIPPSVYQNVSYSYSVSTDHPTHSEHSITGYGMGWFRSSYRGHDVVYHSRAIPGFSTLVSFLPSDEIGVTIFANGGDKAGPVMQILNRILDQALHLDSSLTLSSPVDVSPPNTTVKPSGWNLTLSLGDFAGTYSNPGYGAFALCSASSSSSYCAKVQSDFAAVDYVQGDSEPSRAARQMASCMVLAHPHAIPARIDLRHRLYVSIPERVRQGYHAVRNSGDWDIRRDSGVCHRRWVGCWVWDKWIGWTVDGACSDISECTGSG